MAMRRPFIALVLYVICSGCNEAVPPHDKALDNITPPELQATVISPRPDGSSAVLMSIAARPDSSEIAVGTSEGQVLLLDEKLKKIRTINVNGERITVLSFSPDGHLLAVASDPNLSDSTPTTISLFDVDTGTCVRKLVGLKTEVFGVAFSHSGKWIATDSGREDDKIRVWEVRSGKLLGELDNNDLRNWHGAGFSFSPDDKVLFVGGQYCDASKIGAGSLSRLSVYAPVEGSVAFSSQLARFYGATGVGHQVFYSGYRPAKIVVAAYPEGRRVATWILGYPESEQDIDSIQLSANGRHLLVSGFNMTVVHDAMTGAVEFTLGNGDYLRGAVFSDHERAVCAVSNACDVRRWKLPPTESNR